MAGYQLKITLEYTKPPVWRRVIVPDRITFGDLHDIIQVLFGWEDMHLHDFSFSEDMQLHIGPIEEDYYSNDLDEDSICIDEYIKNHKWIRYTYDFGDDWRHKIVFEQEHSDYEKRYPQVIKYKGDNFLEDSGGIFFTDEEETVRDVFDMQEINHWMEKNLIMKKVRKTKKRKGLSDSLTNYNKFTYILETSNSPVTSLRTQNSSYGRNSEDFVDAMKEIMAQRNLELDENTLELWNETMNEFQALINTMSHMDMRRKSLMEKKLEQLGWYFHEEGELSSISIKSNIKKATPKRNHKEILLDLQKDELQGMATALRIYFAKSWNKEKLSTEIAVQLEGHPEYLYYLLNKKEFPEFLKFAKASEGAYCGKLPAYVLRTMLWWGYIDVDFWTGAETTITMSIPKEIEDMVKELEATDWRKECSNIEKTAGEMVRLLLYYGCIELEKFYELCTKILRPMEQEEFYHYIYFTIDGREHIFVIEEEQEKYLCLGDLDIESILDCRKKNLRKEIEYCNLTLLDVERWKKGLGIVYPEWKELGQFLGTEYGITEESIDEWIEFELYPAVVEGSNLEELIAITEEQIEIEGIEQQLRIWKILQDIFLSTRIAGLKGYTREQLAELEKVNPFAITATKEDRKKKKVEKTDNFYETPLEYQKQISEIIKEAKDNLSLAAQKLEKLLEKYNKDHYQSRFLLAKIYREDEQWENAKKVMKLLAEDTEDEELKNILTIWEKEDKMIGSSKRSVKKKSDHNFKLENTIEYSSKGRKNKKKE